MGNEEERMLECDGHGNRVVIEPVPDVWNGVKIPDGFPFKYMVSIVGDQWFRWATTLEEAESIKKEFVSRGKN